MKLKLPNNIYSPQDMAHLIMDIKKYAKWHAQNSVKKAAKTDIEQPPELSSGAQEVIKNWVAEKEITNQILDDLIIELEDFEAYASLMTITLAAPAAPGIEKELVEWCRSNLSKNILVRFEFNGNILGGLVVRLGSRIFDWSFRKQILDNRKKFSEVLHNV